MPNSLSAALKHRQNYLLARQGTIAGNIANAATPNYLAKDIQFTKLVEKSANSLKPAATHSNHMQGTASTGGAGRMSEKTTGMTLDGNSVVMEEEMLKLNETQLNYRMMTQLYSKHAGFQKMVLGRGQ